MTFAYAVKEIARKEFLQLIRSKRLLGIGITTLVAMILLTLVVPLILFNIQGFIDEVAGAGAGFQDLRDVPHIHNSIMLFFLTGVFILSGYFLFQLTPIILTSDAISAEWKNRTIFLILSKPVPRPAFVLGKFVGLVLPAAALTAALLLLDYLIIVAVFPGVPEAADWGRMAGALGMITLGTIAFGALALMFSTLFRSGTVSLLLSVLTWIVLFPLLSSIAFFVSLFQGEVTLLDGGATWSNFLSPATMMGAASEVLAPDVPNFLNFLSGGFSGEASWWAASIALAIHTIVYLAVALATVQLRNFE